ncbi:MAG: GLPGLI family protein [Saprospiraceae bacterium]|nr:GLPGLI family protein [Saprospiraceae bacterium]
MKNAFALAFLLIPLFAKAQEQGKIVYNEHIDFTIELPPEMQQYAEMMPSEQSTYMDLFYNAEASFYKASPKVETAEENPFEEGDGGFQININMGEGAETYINRPEKLVLRAEDMMGKKFLVVGERQNMQWKILPNTREILGYQCQEASIEMDSTVFTAWFSPQIPFSIGPGEFYGLPGAILAVSTDNGDEKINITAEEIDFANYDNEIVRPEKGKKVSQEEFEVIMRERMEEMEKMYGGDGHESEDGTIRIKVISND